MVTYWLIGEKNSESGNNEVREISSYSLSRNPTITYDEPPDSPISPRFAMKSSNVSDLPDNNNPPRSLANFRTISQDGEDNGKQRDNPRIKRLSQTPASSVDLSSPSGSISSLEFPQDSSRSFDRSSFEYSNQETQVKNGTNNTRGVIIEPINNVKYVTRSDADIIVSSVHVKDVVNKFNHTLNKGTDKNTCKKILNSSRGKE